METRKRGGWVLAAWGLVGLAQAVVLGLAVWPERAEAGLVSASGDFTFLTAQTSNEEALVVLDGRNEEIFAYRMDQQQGVELFQRIALPKLFQEARGRFFGRP